MTRTRLVAWSLAAVLSTAFAAAAGAAAWLLHTESGLAWLATRVAGFAGKGLTLDGVRGTLVGGAYIGHIRYAAKDIELHVTDAQLRVTPLSLLRLAPHIEGLRAAEIAVVSKPGEPRGRPPDTLALPVSFSLSDAAVTRLVIDLGKGPIELTELTLDYAGGRTEHRVERLTLHGYDHVVMLKGAIGAHAPFPLKGSATLERREPPQARAEASFSGNLGELSVQAHATSAGARADATATVRPYDALPLAALNVKSNSLDLHAFVSALPHTRIDGEIALERKASLYAGTIRIANSAHGPYDKGRVPLAALRGSVRTDGKTARVSDMVADFGAAGTVHGSGDIERTRAKLALVTPKLNLAGLHGRLRETSLAGRADILLTPARQSVTADLTERDMALALTAHRTGDTVEVPQFRARARGGEAAGEGQIRLSARRPFSLKASLSRFDPRAWGDFPAGSINGTLAAAGTIDGPQIDITFAIRDSRWLDAPLAAQGQVSYAPERLSNAQVDATIGGNSVIAKGALGSPRDVLALRFNATRLGLIDKRLQGTARGTVELSGALRAPGIRFEIAGADLEHKPIGRVKALEARGTLSARPDGPFDVDATLRGIGAREWQLRSVTASVKGTRGAHTGSVDAQGERVDFRARASGGWRAGAGWTGTLHELANRGEAEVTLAAPVAIEIGPKRAHAAAFGLRVVGGTLNVTKLDYERGQLSTTGRLANLPVRAIVALAGGPAEMAGTLRLNGNWSVTNVPRLTGEIAITRESGDVALGVDRSIRIGLQTLALKANFDERGATLAARLRSALASGDAEGRVSLVNSQYTSDSPIAFDADVNIARLAPFAALIDTTVLLDGEARARLQGRGTLADPQITGPLTADKIAIALPAEGIDLKGGSLRATLTRREVRVESFSIRGGEGTLDARGTLARTGFDEASLDWRAERFAILSRPDRRLIVSGKGNGALSGGKLAFNGALRVTEGAFEIQTTSLPTLGDDVVVVGRTPPRPVTPEPKKLQRAAVDVTVDLGGKVHVRGKGLDVWLGGDMRLTTTTQGEIVAKGVVDARRGSFVAYGQQLEIDRGRLYFNGPVANPGLDIVAMRKRQAVEAGVQVSGTLRQPLVNVVSNPPLPEGEALAWLVLGRAPGTAGAGQLSALPLAAGAVMGKAGAPIARALHIDDIGLRSGTASEQFLTVGKRITDRLYVAFEQSLGGAENLLRLEMTLTDRIALRAQAGLTSSFGIFYRYGWD